METLTKIIEKRLRGALAPSHLEVVDDSSRHATHKGARKSGGGHFQVDIESEQFRGKTLLEQHRMVNGILSDMMGTEIHALALKTRIPQRGSPAQ